jgi:hypothetical protein
MMLIPEMEREDIDCDEEYDMELEVNQYRQVPFGSRPYLDQGRSLG